MRRSLAVAALAASVTLSVAPAPASAFFCVWVGDICLPCGPANAAYRKVTGGDLLTC